MVLEPRRAAGAAELPDPEPGPGEVLVAGARLRRLPHRPPRRRRRAARAEAAARPGPPDRRHGRRRRGRGRSASRSASGSACPGSAGPAASAATAARAARTSASGRASPATTSTAATPSCAIADERFCFPLPEGYPDLQAAPLLCAGPDRLPGAALCGRRRAARPLRLRRLGPHRLPGRASTRAGASSPSPARATSEGQEFARGLGAEWAGRLRRGAAGAARRGDRLRAGRASWCRRRCARSRRGGDGRLRRDPHERHPGLPLRDPLGRARRALGRQPDAPRRRGVHGPRAAGAGMRTEIASYPLWDANHALEDLRRGRVRGAAVLVPDLQTRWLT